MRRRLNGKGLGRDRRGVAAVEFALWSTLIFLALVPVLDFGVYLLTGSRLAATVQQASILAFNMRDQDVIDTAPLTAYVAASGSGVTASVVCNGGAASCGARKADRQCACVTGVSTYSSTSCAGSCGNGSKPGFYLTVQASRSYSASVVPGSFLEGDRVSRAVTVRLQ
ncbi:TadE/TadG family type IV pilus assembly protein [Sphingomonas colocasiae]|uniref:Pilus assembly protein n=1 Tax=Sphingomonas colocasiae TaxID=1848973 RepID=A0ABS7PIZ6_9SPHN|nr:TadE/TadG family type IV pilus assembly protein [Sphingomonas colocasiae]MBY8821276.1 pilus assembly protein [Sphingomonas colocasiae]